MKAGTRTAWTFVITSIALFMVVLDNLVVSTALPVIRVDLGASIEQLEWIVNAYTFTFAVFLLTGAALGDRFGRKRMFIIGLAIFTGASAMAALAPSTEWLIAARALQGMGGAIVTPLTLTILSGAVSSERRGAALGAWSGIAGFAVAMGPLVGGAVVEGISWQWVFWLNVPVGLILLPLATQLRESYGADKHLDIPGVVLGGLGLLGLVWGLVNGNSDGWTSPQIVGSLVVGAVILAAFVGWELRTNEPMLPMRFFRDRAFSAANGASLFMYFGMFGSIFLLTQFFQTSQGFSPLESGVRVLPWTAMPLIVAPIAGALYRPDRWRAHHGHGARASGDRPGMDRGRYCAGRGLCLARRAFHPVGDRDGHVLRAGGLCRPLGSPAAGRGQGLGSEQRDQGGRRCLRRRRSRLTVRALRRLCDQPDLQRRPRPRTLGRRGRGRRRLPPRAADPAQATGAGG